MVVGKMVGKTLGIEVGSEVGWVDGTEVGWVDGTEVGSAEGVSEGTPVGQKEGAAEGTDVGGGGMKGTRSATNVQTVKYATSIESKTPSTVSETEFTIPSKKFADSVVTIPV